jgi:hypothetical protein
VEKCIIYSQIRDLPIFLANTKNTYLMINQFSKFHRFSCKNAQKMTHKKNNFIKSETTSLTECRKQIKIKNFHSFHLWDVTRLNLLDSLCFFFVLSVRQGVVDDVNWFTPCIYSTNQNKNQQTFNLVNDERINYSFEII